MTSFFKEKIETCEEEYKDQITEDSQIFNITKSYILLHSFGINSQKHKTWPRHMIMLEIWKEFLWNIRKQKNGDKSVNNIKKPNRRVDKELLKKMEEDGKMNKSKTIEVGKDEYFKRFDDKELFRFMFKNNWLLSNMVMLLPSKCFKCQSQVPKESECLGEIIGQDIFQKEMFNVTIKSSKSLTTTESYSFEISRI